MIVGGNTEPKPSDDKSFEPVRKLTQKEIEQINEAFGNGGGSKSPGAGTTINGAGPKLKVGGNTTVQGARTKSTAPSGNSGSRVGVKVTVKF